MNDEPQNLAARVDVKGAPFLQKWGMNARVLDGLSLALKNCGAERGTVFHTDLARARDLACQCESQGACQIKTWIKHIS